jgi:methylmalonyl-CoA/ethylmalonyl-CoA epimerase
MDLRLHHIGILARDISKETQAFESRFGYHEQGGVIHDSTQTAYVQFMKLSNDRVYLEFISPDGPGSKLQEAMDKGVKLHHLCYATDSLAESCAELRKKGMTLIQPPVGAQAFPGRRIAWLMGRDRMLIELVERGPREDLP